MYIHVYEYRLIEIGNGIIAGLLFPVYKLILILMHPHFFQHENIQKKSQ